MTDSMTAHEMTSLRVGDVLTSTDVLETYPNYWIEAGARFVVVTNSLAEERAGLLSMRLAPADKGKLKAGDLSHWCDAVEIYEPAQDGVEHRPGVDPADRAAAGNAWTLRTVTVRPTPGALTLEERVAAVFTQKLFQDIDGEGMSEVVRRNATETDPGVCHSHDFCDSNMPMLAAFQAMGLKTPLDAVDDPSLGDGPAILWNASWSTAMRDWMPLAPAEDREADRAAAP